MAEGHFRVKLGPVAFSGFPARNLARRVHEESGEWIIAYQAEQTKHLTAVLKSSKKLINRGEGSKVIYAPTNTRESSCALRNILDKPFLLSHCYAERPSDLSIANISGCELKDYNSEDLEKFDNVVSINASDNHLPFEAFASLSSLQTLELSLNFIMHVFVEPEVFLKLQYLDLSYNYLNGVSLLVLGTLPALKELRLTGNNLVALPVEMSMPYVLEGGSELAQLRFPVLEKLWVDDNKLSDQTTFATLAGLRKLKYLNLDNNEMYTIPHLKLLGTSPLKRNREESSNQVKNSRGSPNDKTGGSSPNDRTDRDSPNYKNSPNDGGSPNDIPSEDSTHTRMGDNVTRSVSSASTHAIQSDDVKISSMSLPSSAHHTRASTNVDATIRENDDRVERTESLGHISQLSQYSRPEDSQLHHKISTDSVPISNFGTNINQNHDTRRRVGVRRDKTVEVEPLTSSTAISLGTDFVPFPALQTLSLVNNLILYSEGVIACMPWPALQEIIIYNNPLTRTSKGMPPLIQEYLVDKLGINVVRMEPDSPKRNAHIREIVKDLKKISLALPPAIPRNPLPAIEAPHLTSLDHSPSPHTHSYSSPFSHQSLNSGPESHPSQGSSGSAGIFMTQVSGLLEAEEQQDPPLPAREHSKEQYAEESWSAKDAFRSKLKHLRKKYKDLPDKYRGYEILLDLEDDPSDNIPLDIHGCTRALQYALKHPLVMSDYCPPCHVHPSTIEQEKYARRKTTDPVTTMGTHSSDATSSKILRLKKVLNDIKTQSHETETNLATALKPQSQTEKKNSLQLQRDAKKLLSEMQAHYDKVRASSLYHVSAPHKSTHSNSGTIKGHRVQFEGLDS